MPYAAVYNKVLQTGIVINVAELWCPETGVIDNAAPLGLAGRCKNQSCLELVAPCDTDDPRVNNQITDFCTIDIHFADDIDFADVESNAIGGIGNVVLHTNESSHPDRVIPMWF